MAETQGLCAASRGAVQAERRFSPAAAGTNTIHGLVWRDVWEVETTPVHGRLPRCASEIVEQAGLANKRYGLRNLGPEYLTLSSALDRALETEPLFLFLPSYFSLSRT